MPPKKKTENAAGVQPGLIVLVNNAGTIAHQAAGSGEFASTIECGYRLALHQRHEFFAPIDENRVVGHEECAGPDPKPGDIERNFDPIAQGNVQSLARPGEHCDAAGELGRGRVRWRGRRPASSALSTFCVDRQPGRRN